MISGGPTYDETVSSYSCQRNNPQVSTIPSKPKPRSGMRLQMLKASFCNVEANGDRDGRLRQTGFARWCWADGLRRQVRKLYCGPHSALNGMWWWPNHLSLWASSSSTWHGSVRLDNRRGLFMVSSLMRWIYFLLLLEVSWASDFPF